MGSASIHLVSLLAGSSAPVGGRAGQGPRDPAPLSVRSDRYATLLVADDIRLSEERAGAVLSCRLRGAGLPERLWFQVPPELAGSLATTGDALLPPLLVAAMRRAARLVIDGEVSAALLGATPAIMELFEQASEAIGQPMCRVAVEAQCRPREARGPAAGAFFSGGIDSFYTVLRNAARYEMNDARRITHLITVHGFDVRIEDRALFTEVRERLSGAARDLGMLLVPVKTNVRDVVSGIPWEYAHGAAMAGTGLALGCLLHTCYIAGARSMRTSGFWGTHPGLDPLWSTETLEFVSDGPMLGRMMKAPFVVASAVARHSLRVCWKNPNGAYNCGRCEKCLRTMVIFTLCGALGRVETLPAAVDCEALAKLRIPPDLFNRWQGLRRRLAAGGPGVELLPALDRALAASRRLQPATRRAEAALFRGLGRIGLTPRRFKALDGWLLSGRGARAFRRLTGRARQR